MFTYRNVFSTYDCRFPRTMDSAGTIGDDFVLIFAPMPFLYSVCLTPLDSRYHVPFLWIFTFNNHIVLTNVFYIFVF